MRHQSAGLWIGAMFVLGIACSDDAANSGGAGSGASASTATSQGGGLNTGGASTGTAQTGAGTYSSGVGGAPTEVATCQGKIYACGDLLDNDGDGLIDYQDPDCLGPCDNTEDSYFGGIPGQNNAPCKQDCYFDQDSGHGNDDCHWSHRCDPNEIAPGYYPEPEKGDQCEYQGADYTVSGSGKTCAELDQAQSQACHDYCGPLTPNGCDCFGCCELPAGTNQFVWLGSTGVDGTSVCTQADINDPTKCHPCVPVADCLNECEPCELCIGKPAPDPGCNPGSGGGGTGGAPPGGQCDPGVQPCGLLGQVQCPGGFYCVTGCCQAVPQ